MEKTVNDCNRELQSRASWWLPIKNHRTKCSLRVMQQLINAHTHRKVRERGRTDKTHQLLKWPPLNRFAARSTKNKMK